MSEGGTAHGLSVLMLCYHFPPMATTGGLRPARFIRYFPPHVKVDVLTVADPREARDDSTLYDAIKDRCTVHHARMRRWLSWQTRDDLGGLAGWLGKVHKTVMTSLVWIPDREVAWVRHAQAEALELIEAQRPDVIFCTAPPHSLSLVGRNLKRRTGIPLVVDFRDPWTDNPQRVWRSHVRRGLERHLESSVVMEADAVIANTPGNRDMLLRTFPGLLSEKVSVITNGFDPDRRAVMTASHAPNTPRRILFTGHVYEGTETVADALEVLLSQDPSLPEKVRFEFIGTRDLGVQRRFEGLVNAGLVELSGSLPNDAIPERIAGADALLYAVPRSGRHWIPSKLYDYLLASKPILGVLPRGDAWEILESSGLATLVETTTAREMAAGVSAFVEALMAGHPVCEPVSEAIDRFDARRLTQDLVSILTAVAQPS
jgi:hypothetical protein